GTDPVDICAISDMDGFSPGWQAAAQDEPNTALVAGLNLIGLSPTPDGIYSISATVVENAPIPTSGSDFVQMGRDDYDAILDEAPHLAEFKEGGANFVATYPLHQRFLKQAAIYNEKLLALGTFSDMMLSLSMDQERVNPRLQSSKVVAGG